MTLPANCTHVFGSVFCLNCGISLDEAETLERWFAARPRESKSPPWWKRMLRRHTVKPREKTQAELDAELDELARRYLNMTGAEFREAARAGALPDTPAVRYMLVFVHGPGTAP